MQVGAIAGNFAQRENPGDHLNHPSRSGAEAIRFTGLKKSYAGAAVLRGLDMGVPAGRTFGLVGMNGAGKTTLIKCLLDFCDFDAGEVRIFGVPGRETRARAPLAFLPERFVPPYYLTGRDFLRYMARLYGRAYVDAEAERAAAGIDLDPGALEKPVRAFSKGMTQKLGLAACLLSGRELLVLDEPTSGLDPRARALLKRRLQEAREAGRTVFFTSHALADVEELCDDMAVLHQGELRFHGAPGALREKFAAATLEEAYLACIG